MARADRLRFLTPEGAPRAFVIVSSARSGSNLLVGYLRQVRQAACFGEILRPEFVTKPGWDKLVARLELPAEAMRLHTDDMTAFWELFLAQGLRRRRWLGAKAFYYHRRGDPVWERFAEPDHRIIHLWRDSTFDQYVSRLLAVASGEWKSPADGEEQYGQAVGSTERSDDRWADLPGVRSVDSGPSPGVEPSVTFDRGGYLRYRAELRADIEATRARYGGSGRYIEVEYQRLLDHDYVGSLLEGMFGERIDIAETLRRQRGRPKIEYLTNPADAEPFAADSVSRGYQ